MKNKQKNIIIVCLFISMLWLSPRAASAVLAEDVQLQDSHPVVIYFFWGEGCPHCAEAKPFLETLSQRNPQVEVLSYELWYNEENQQLFQAMCQAVGFEPRYVPTIIIGQQRWEGFGDSIRQGIENKVAACLASGCPDMGVGVIPGRDAQPEASPNPQSEKGMDSAVIQLPVLGEIDLASRSLWISTAIIGFVDGFNPCSLWVLSILIALTLHTGSRQKIFTIGLIYITVTAGVYVLFIAGLFTMLTVVSFMGWIQAVVSVLALFFAVVNVKDYFWYKEGLSFTIAEDKKSGIYKKIRNVMNAGESFWSLAAATVALGGGVSLVEFSCTAGFPVVWTNLVAAQDVVPLTFVVLLLLYMVIYQIDELGIFLVAVFTLRASRLEEKHGRILKLIGGMLMLTLSLVMLFKPALMNNLTSSLIIFGIAFTAALLVLIVHRKILPYYGIYIGSEMQSQGKRKKFGKKKRS